MWTEPGLSAARVRLPPTVPLTGAYMSDAGAYLLDSGRIFVLWLGKRVPKDFISQVWPFFPSLLQPSLHSSLV